MISRRDFLVLSGAVMLAPSFCWAEDQFPSALDHIILGSSDLDRGIKFVEERTGVRAAIGGVHPDRGTMNALASLGDLHYLEIMAPDPNARNVQSWALPMLNSLKQSTTPRLINWAVHPGDVEALAKKLKDAGIAATGPSPGSRIRPDGRVLHWKSLNLADNRHGLLPFFIEWSADSPHPSSDAPAGCRLEHFSASDPDPSGLSKTYRNLGVEVLVERGETSQLKARIRGPKGTLEVTS